MTLQQQFEKAMEIAWATHGGQVDKGGAPYMNHVVHVMQEVNIVRPMRGKIVALLHDVLEDNTTLTLGSLYDAGMDHIVLDALNAITRRLAEPYAEYIERVAKNSLGKVVKLVDLKHNMDISRIPSPTKEDYDRLVKYELAYQRLCGNLDSPCVTVQDLEYEGDEDECDNDIPISPVKKSASKSAPRKY